MKRVLFNSKQIKLFGHKIDWWVHINVKVKKLNKKKVVGQKEQVPPRVTYKNKNWKCSDCKFKSVTLQEADLHYRETNHFKFRGLWLEHGKRTKVVYNVLEMQKKRK